MPRCELNWSHLTSFHLTWTKSSCTAFDGRELTVRQTSRLASQCGSVRMCNKETRSEMNPESLQACSRAAMGHVLPKTHELCLPSVKTSGEKASRKQLQVMKVWDTVSAAFCCLSVCLSSYHMWLFIVFFWQCRCCISLMDLSKLDQNHCSHS